MIISYSFQQKLSDYYSVPSTHQDSGEGKRERERERVGDGKRQRSEKTDSRCNRPKERERDRQGADWKESHKETTATAHACIIIRKQQSTCRDRYTSIKHNHNRPDPISMIKSSASVAFSNTFPADNLTSIYIVLIRETGPAVGIRSESGAAIQ